jgi:tRNA1(Val) A37 N6-methylase TrmN6
MDTASITAKLSEYFDSAAIKKINFKGVNSEKDLLSTIFEKASNEEKRKSLAQFFTHKELVKFIVDSLPITENSLILDPACGAGAFLISSLSKNNANSENIYGLDLDPTALALCSLNLEMLTGEKKFNLVQTDSINEFSLNEVFPEVAAAGGFDIVLGNPPFKNLGKDKNYDANDVIYKSIVNGIANSATLMIGKSYSILKEGGYLGFVLPKNILRVYSFSKLRKFLLKNTRLILIYDVDHYFKDVRGDQIVLIFQKRKLSEAEQKANFVGICVRKKRNIFSDPYSYHLSQKDFSKFEVFPIFYEEKIITLAEKLLGINSTLESVTEGKIFRGLPIGANNSALSKSDFRGAIPTLRGDSICRFGTKYRLYLDPSAVKGQNKSRLNCLFKQKIVLQNLTSREGGVFATLSDENELTLDTVTNIVIDDHLERKYILGLLNSKITNFFIIFVVFLHSNFTMHADRKYIGKLPVIIPRDNRFTEAVSIVDRLLLIETKYSKEFFEAYDELNKKLFELYGFSDEEIRVMEQCLKEVMSGRQYGRTNE